MKQIIFGILLALSTSANASQNIEVTGEKAKAIITALENVGAQRRMFIEGSMFDVQNIKLNYTPRGFVWAQGHLVDNVAGGKELMPIGSAAHGLLSALEDAGAPVTIEEQPIQTTILEVNHLECMSVFAIGLHRMIHTCTIQ